jgi:hypothetical protein
MQNKNAGHTTIGVDECRLFENCIVVFAVIEYAVDFCWKKWSCSFSRNCVCFYSVMSVNIPKNPSNRSPASQMGVAETRGHTIRPSLWRNRPS